ncbi:MAG: type II toxin-antitoxin system RelE/ParE family toxin [Armatimonadetes bacterium]|nr:type II toxin-antitoxin system RelE/ParE family toxin [Armatimonadota bacterium]
MPYRVVIARAILQDMRRLPGYVRQRVKRACYGLGDNHQPAGAKPLGDPYPPGFFRIRLDEYRIAYHLDPAMRVVTILRVGYKGGGRVLPGSTRTSAPVRRWRAHLPTDDESDSAIRSRGGAGAWM